MQRILAVDTDTKQIAYAVTDQELLVPTTDSIVAKEKRAEQRFPVLVSNFVWLIHSFDPPPTWVYLERPVVGRNARAAIDQGRVLGAFEACLLAARIPFSEVDNTVWKKALLGNGRATKEDVRAWVEASYGFAPKSQDECDALAIARWGQLALSGGALTK